MEVDVGKMIDMTTNPWQVLGVHRATEQADIKAKYKELMWQHHPDQGGTAEKAAEVTEAYKILINPMLVKSYVDTLNVLGAPCSPCGGHGYTFKQKGLTQRVTQPCSMCGGRGIVAKGV